MKVGLIVESLKIPFAEGVAFAAAHGISGIQMHSRRRIWAPQTDPDLMTAAPEVIRQCLDCCEKHGVEISAICGDGSPYSFQVAAESENRVADLKRVVDQTAQMGVKVITTHIGHIPESVEDPVYPLMVKGVREAAEYAAAKKCVFAIETGPELADVLKTFIETVGSEGLGVNMDPANLRGVCCEDPAFAVKTLAPYIVHTHAKDAINTMTGSAAKFYRLRNLDGSERQIAARPAGFQEVPLGQGMVDWAAYLGELRAIGYDGFLTIERECGENPAADILTAVDFLKKQLGQ